MTYLNTITAEMVDASHVIVVGRFRAYRYESVFPQRHPLEGDRRRVGNTSDGIWPSCDSCFYIWELEFLYDPFASRSRRIHLAHLVAPAHLPVELSLVPHPGVSQKCESRV